MKRERKVKNKLKIFNIKKDSLDSEPNLKNLKKIRKKINYAYNNRNFESFFNACIDLSCESSCLSDLPVMLIFTKTNLRKNILYNEYYKMRTKNCFFISRIRIKDDHIFLTEKNMEKLFIKKTDDLTDDSSRIMKEMLNCYQRSKEELRDAFYFENKIVIENKIKTVQFIAKKINNCINCLEPTELTNCKAMQEIKKWNNIK